MSLFWTRANLDEFGDLVRLSLAEERKAREASSLEARIVQPRRNGNPVVTIKTRLGAMTFEVERTPGNAIASPAQMRALVAAKLDSIGI